VKEITKELKKIENCLDFWGEIKNVTVKLNQNQFDALVLFTFNVGIGYFKHSTALKELNKGNYKKVPFELKRWNQSGGKVMRGLINRRNKEIQIWNKK